MNTIIANRIELPKFARRPDIDKEGDFGEDSFSAFQKIMPEILNYLHKELERSFNDSDIFFLHEKEGFPLRDDITGDYYISDTIYDGDEEVYELNIMFHCLCNDNVARMDSNDYVSMEMIVYLKTKTGDIEYEPEFQKAAI